MNYFLIKSEPSTYSFEQLMADGRTRWDGVRNFEARNNLRAMAPGDLLLFYHSGPSPAVVGLAKVVKAAYPDPTADSGDWSAVDVAKVKPLKTPVPLARLKAEPGLEGFKLLTHSRLSVVQAEPAHFERVLALGQTKR